MYDNAVFRQPPRGTFCRTRDKMSAARRKSKWVGGHPVLGYDIDPKGGRIIVNPAEAEQVKTIFGLYMAKGSTLPLLQETQRVALVSKQWTTEDSRSPGRSSPGRRALLDRKRAPA